MSLKFGQLKEVADGVIKRQKLLDAVTTEARDTFGPFISTCADLSRVCDEILNRSDLLEARGRPYAHHFKTSTLKKLLESGVQPARLVAARFLPVDLTKDLATDRDPDIRYEACKRLPADVVKEASESYPADFGVKMLLEAKAPAHDSEHLHMYDKKRMGKAARPAIQPDFTDAFYHTHALKAVQDYGTNVEGQWEEVYVKRYCSSYTQTTGIEIDAGKLYKSVMAVLKKKDDDALTQGELKRLEKLHRMRESAERVSGPSEGQAVASSSDFIKRVNESFRVRQAMMPAGLRKYTVSSGDFMVPMKATAPGGVLTYDIERTLDDYVSRWNATMQLVGESVQLSWTPDPVSAGGVCFNLVIK